MPDQPQQMQARRKSFEMLHVPLTLEEVADLGREIARLMGEASALELQRKASNDVFKSKIDLLEAQRDEASAKIRIGSKEQRVAVDVVFDYEHGEVRVEREDTGKLVRARTLTLQERQLEFENTRVPGQLIDFGGGKVLELHDERSLEQKLHDDGIVENEKPADGVRADLEEVQPVSGEPSTVEPSMDDDIPFGADADDEPATTDDSLLDQPVSRLREGDAVWLTDGDGLAVGPRMTVSGFRDSVTKGVVWVSCKFDDGHVEQFKHERLTMIAPIEKKTRAAKQPKATADLEDKLDAALAEPKPRKLKPKFVQGQEVKQLSDGAIVAICSSSVYADGIRYIVKGKDFGGTRYENELEPVKPARKPRATKAAVAS